MSLIKRHSVLDPWFPVRYSLDLYSGCTAGCLYCPASWGETVAGKSNNYSNSASTASGSSTGPSLTQLEQELVSLRREIEEFSTSPQREIFIGLGAGLHDPLLPPGGGGENVFLQVCQQLAASGTTPFILTKAPNVLVQLLTSPRGQQYLGNQPNQQKDPSYREGVTSSTRELASNGANSVKGVSSRPRRSPIVMVTIPLVVDEEEEYAVEGTAPRINERLAAIRDLHALGLPLGVLIQSLAPWDMEGEAHRLITLIRMVADLGVNFISLHFLDPASTATVYTRLCDSAVERHGSHSHHSHSRFAEGLRAIQAAEPTQGQGSNISNSNSKHSWHSSYGKSGKNNQRSLTSFNQGAITGENSDQDETNGSRDPLYRAKYQLETVFKQELRRLGISSMPPALLYRENLSTQDAIAVSFMQLYYLQRDLGRRRDFFKLAAYHLSTMAPMDFNAALRRRQFTNIPGIGEYSERLILQMALRQDYQTFDRVFMEWHRL